MSREYLIDGYNLLYAMGLVDDRAGPDMLDHARRRLLQQVADGHGTTAAVTVVFDAKRLPPDADDYQQFYGIDVVFAVKYKEADDYIEEHIRHHSSPRQLTVVSDDRRLQQAASRRRCVARKCADYLDWLDRQAGRPQRRRSPQAEQQNQPDEKEVQHWLKEFADLDDDPAMKELFDPFGFEDK